MLLSYLQIKDGCLKLGISVQSLGLAFACEYLSSCQEGTGGVTGYLKSLIGGAPANSSPAAGDAKTTHTQELKDGSTAAVHTAPDQATGAC